MPTPRNPQPSHRTSRMVPFVRGFTEWLLPVKMVAIFYRSPSSGSIRIPTHATRLFVSSRSVAGHPLLISKTRAPSALLFLTNCSAPVHDKDAFVRKCRKLVQSEEEVEVKEEWEFLTEDDMREAGWTELPTRI